MCLLRQINRIVQDVLTCKASLAWFYNESLFFYNRRKIFKLLNCAFYRNTAKTFYAASIFYEILSQFGELQPDVSS